MVGFSYICILILHPMSGWRAGRSYPPPLCGFCPLLKKIFRLGCLGLENTWLAQTFCCGCPYEKKSKKNYSTPSQSIFETRSIQKYFFFALTKKFCVQTLIKWFVDIIEFSFRFLGPPYKQYEVFFSHKECWVSKKSLSPKEFLENTQNLRF